MLGECSWHHLYVTAKPRTTPVPTTVQWTNNLCFKHRIEYYKEVIINEP